MEKRIRLATKKEAGEGYALPAGISMPPPPVVPERVREPESPPPEQSPFELPPAESPAENLPFEPASNVEATAEISPPTDSSGLDGAAPVLLGLLGLSVLLLGLAAMPPWHTHGAVAELLVRRRVELGLLGTAVLVSAAVGLVIAVVSS
jgi:hypothetical protein